MMRGYKTVITYYEELTIINLKKFPEKFKNNNLIIIGSFRMIEFE